MDRTDKTCSLVLSEAEVETLKELVAAKIEGVLVHSEEYFRLEDLAHKLRTALGSP